MNASNCSDLLRRHTLRLAEEVVGVGASDPATTGFVLSPCVEPNGGMTEELLSALSEHHKALETLESVVGRVEPKSFRPGDPVAQALDGAYEASDVAHDSLRGALVCLRDAARMQRDALRVAHLAMMVAAESA